MTPTPTLGSVRFFLGTPHPAASGGAAIAIIQLDADTPALLDAALGSLNLSPLLMGRPALRDLLGVDRGLVVRWSPTSAQLMPHAGPLIIERLCAALADHGISPAPEPIDPRAAYPEARDLVEACTLDALARAHSPLAIDVLLRQRDLWSRSLAAGDAAALAGASSGSDRLDRLITPPTIVLLGPPNVGKSTLTNALARRAVSIVSDQPGTTRDHVGVTLDLAGLVVSWIDTPGLRDPSDTSPPDPIESAAAELALAVARSADLVLSCADARSVFLDPPPETSGRPTLRIATRADLGPAPGADVITSAASGRGLADLAVAVRDALVSPYVIRSDALWRFHAALPRA